MAMWMACYTQEEIAEVCGMSQQNVSKVLQRIDNYEIVVIPGLYAEGRPADSAPDRQKKEFETARQAKIQKTNQDNAEHAVDFEVPIYNVCRKVLPVDILCIS